MAERQTPLWPPTRRPSTGETSYGTLTELARQQAAKPLERTRHLGRPVLAAIVLAALVWFIASLASNHNIRWDIVRHYLASGAILRGLWVTIELSLVAMVLAVLAGLVMAVWALSSNPVLRWISYVWIWFFRGVPLLVQLLVWGNFALLFAHVQIGIPGTDFHVLRVSTNSVITGFVAAVLGLGLHEGAYMSEIIRGGIQAVHRGQRDAGSALGLTNAQVMRKIVLPQSLRIIIPATGNQFISLLKASSLVSVIAGGDLLTSAERIYAVNYATLELLFVATFWYLVIVSVTTVIQSQIERHMARGRNYN